MISKPFSIWKPQDLSHRWLRPEDFGSPLQERFNIAYKKHLRENMKFKSDIEENVNSKLKTIAKKFYKEKNTEITYVG